MNIREILKDYEPNYTIFNEDEDYIHKIKHIIFNDLSLTDRTIIVLYSELQSQRKVGKLLGVSSATVNSLIKNIRGTIINKLKEIS